MPYSQWSANDNYTPSCRPEKKNIWSQKNRFLRNRIQNVTSCFKEGMQLQCLCLYCHTMYSNISDQQETVVLFALFSYDHRVHRTSSSKSCSCSHLNKYWSCDNYKMLPNLIGAAGSVHKIWSCGTVEVKHDALAKPFLHFQHIIETLWHIKGPSFSVIRVLLLYVLVYLYMYYM